MKVRQRSDLIVLNQLAVQHWLRQIAIAVTAIGLVFALAILIAALTMAGAK